MAVLVNRHRDVMRLLARLIARDEILAPILDPLDRPTELDRGEAHQQVLRVQLAAHAEAAANVPLEKVDAGGIPLKHSRKDIAVGVRPLGRAV